MYESAVGITEHGSIVNHFNDYKEFFKVTNMKILFELSALARACLETLKGSLWSLLFSCLAIICMGGQCEYMLISILETKTQLICKPRAYPFIFHIKYFVYCTIFSVQLLPKRGGAAYPSVTRNTQRHTVACCHDVQAIMS